MADHNQPNQMPSPRRAPDMTWLLLSPFGRVGREIYWLGMGFALCISEVLARIWQQSLVIELTPEGGIETIQLTDVSIMTTLALLPVNWMILAVLAKRCHDRGMSGFLSLLWLVPLVNFAFLIFMGVMAGNPGPNRYGPGPDSRA